MCLVAILNDNLNCITTDCNFIPAPPLGGACEVQEKKDFFFGDSDFPVWPQLYIPSLPHLPFIHYREADVYENNHSFLWELPDSSRDFIHHSADISGFGKLSLSVVFL